MPSAGQRDQYPSRWLRWLDDVPDDERDEDAVNLRSAVDHFSARTTACAGLGVNAEGDRHKLLITHNFVIGWFVRHALDAPVWRWIGLDQANCAITVVQWGGNRPPALISFNDTGHLHPE